MITKTELMEIAKIKSINNIGYAEKDYLIELFLFSISRNTKRELIFKGGTALYKFYKLERFSEDLDFSEIVSINIENLSKKIISDLLKFRVEIQVFKVKEPFNSILLNFRAKGPLYNSNDITLSSIKVDINKKSKVELEPLRLRFSSLYTEIPPFYILVMQEKEILAEKIRALVTRNKARDLFDILHLIHKNIDIDKKLVKKKLNYYDLNITDDLLLEAIDRKKNIWDNELRPVINELPSFKDVKNKVLENMPKFD